MKEFQERDDVEFHIYTNAYNRKRLDQVIDNVDISKLQIQVSYDGKEINDQFRLSLTGKPTSDEVVGNVEYLARRGVNVSLKSTIPLKTMDTLYRTWKDFEQLYEKLHAIGPNIHVSYSPTIDYVEEIPRENLDELIASFRKDMIRIAKEEIKFYKKHHRHLCSWFAGSDSKTHCASGANMHAIDVDGNTYACHGSLYSPNKESMKGGNILDDNWVDAVIAMSKNYREAIKVVPETCVNCQATTCMICPVSSLDNSKNVDFFDRWTDRWVNNMCGFFKAFGEIDRTVQAYLYNEIAVLDKKDLQEEKA
jgi:radical SAM protein with 4Fe4S-binding SPASM domain